MYFVYKEWVINGLSWIITEKLFYSYIVCTPKSRRYNTIFHSTFFFVRPLGRTESSFWTDCDGNTPVSSDNFYAPSLDDDSLSLMLHMFLTGMCPINDEVRPALIVHINGTWLTDILSIIIRPIRQQSDFSQPRDKQPLASLTAFCCY